MLAPESFQNLPPDEHLPFKRLLFTELVFRGRLQEAKNLHDSHSDSFLGTGASGMLLFLQGDPEKALDAFDTDLEFLRKFSDDEKVAIFGPAGLFSILARMKCESRESYSSIADTIGTVLSLFSRSNEKHAYNYLGMVINSHVNEGHQVEGIHLPEDGSASAITIVFAGLCQYWLNSSIEPEITSLLREMNREGQKSGYDFFTLILAGRP